MKRSSAWFKGLFITVITLLMVLLLCHVIIKQNCDGSTDCLLAYQTLSPASFNYDQLSSDILLQAKSVLASGTSPNDFANMGHSVAVLLSLFDYQHSAQASRLDAEDAQTLAEHLKAAVLHLFPFVSTQYQTAMGDLEHHNSGSRGLVIPCGSSDFHFALHLVAAVRHVFHSTLPIEIMYAGDSDLSEDQQEALEAVGEDIRTVDILHFYHESSVGLLGGGWAIKPFAILASSFEQVIIADSDVVFLQSPERLFDHPGYNETGTLFFHDRLVGGSNDVHNWWRSVMQDRTPSSMMAESLFWAGKTIHEMESGAVVFNKDNRSVMFGLLYVAWMNTRVIRAEITYRQTLGTVLTQFAVGCRRYMQIPECAFNLASYADYFFDHSGNVTASCFAAGDKESYWMAFELAKIPYHFDPVYASAIGHVTKAPITGTILLCPSHLLHLDHEANPMWYNGSLFRGKRAPKSQRQWMNPVVWAPDTGSWDGTACMLEVEQHGGARPMSDGGWDKVYSELVQVATTWDAKYDGLII